MPNQSPGKPGKDESSKISVVVNGSRTLTLAATMADLLRLLAKGNDAVATALNGEFVPAGKRGETRLHPNDEIEIVAPRQGG